MKNPQYSENQFNINRIFSEACSKGNLAKIKKLIASDISHIKVDQEGMNKALVAAYMFNKVKVIEYLLTSPDLSLKAEVHHKNDILFRLAYDEKNYAVLNYLIDEFKIEQTPRIIEEIKKEPNRIVERKFMLRDLNKELNINEVQNKRIKV